tara:strand:- start:224 stop:469 length:246 start_codon:yes stop_codon:yes gene_type:complete
MPTEQEIHEVVEYLQSLKEESDSNKKFREKADSAISILQSGHQLAVEKALFELEELNSVDLPSYHRTQVWDVISMLESIKN